MTERRKTGLVDAWVSRYLETLDSFAKARPPFPKDLPAFEFYDGTEYENCSEDAMEAWREYDKKWLDWADAAERAIWAERPSKGIGKRLLETLDVKRRRVLYFDPEYGLRDGDEPLLTSLDQQARARIAAKKLTVQQFDKKQKIAILKE